VVDAYRGLVGARTVWDPTSEHPDLDARDAPPEPIDPSVLWEAGSGGIVLSNGARLYVDHAHPEYSTPECADALEAVRHDRAGELVLERAAVAATAALEGHGEVLVHKNNTDGKGAAYGTHENHLVPRRIPFGLIARHLTDLLVSRIPLVGSGRLGSALDPGVGFQISQRADFLEAELGIETTVRRPIVNTRDEPHADPDRHRRLHIITGDANLCEVATLVKVGSLQLVLEALAADRLGPPIDLIDPVMAAHRVSHDLTLAQPLPCADGRSRSALDVQRHYLERCRRHVDLEGGDAVDALVLDWWERILDGLSTDASALDGVLDWVTKRRLIEAYRERHGLAPDDARLHLIDLQYHDLRPGRGLHRRLLARGDVVRLVSDAEVERAIDEAPERTRAWLRGAAIRRFPEAVVAAGWDGLVLDVGGSLKRLPMPEPARGTRAQLGDLMEAAAGIEELIEALGSRPPGPPSGTQR
jgi:proteasome accessory factor A